MSQRNPMNDRYQTDEHKGQTRKSAAAAKPKSKAASTVRVQSTAKPKKQAKAEKREQDRKRRQVESKYYNPPTQEYKTWRKRWWIFLIGAIVMTAASFLLRSLMPQYEVASLVILGLAYIGIVGALVIDFGKIRKIRQKYQAEMQGKINKEERAMAKKEHADKVAARKAAEEAEKTGEKPQEEPKKGLFSFSGLRGAAQRASDANKGITKSDAGSKDSQADGDTADASDADVSTGKKKGK